MRIVTIGEVVDANKALGEQGIPCKVHLSDACGRQTLWLEPLDGCDLDAAQEAVRGFFRGLRCELEFAEDGKTFWGK